MIPTKISSGKCPTTKSASQVRPRAPTKYAAPPIAIEAITNCIVKYVRETQILHPQEGQAKGPKKSICFQRTSELQDGQSAPSGLIIHKLQRTAVERHPECYQGRLLSLGSGWIRVVQYQLARFPSVPGSLVGGSDGVIPDKKSNTPCTKSGCCAIQS